MVEEYGFDVSFAANVDTAKKSGKQNGPPAVSV